MHTGLGLQFANLDTRSPTSRCTAGSWPRRPGRGGRLRLGVGLRAPLLGLPADLAADRWSCRGSRRRRTRVKLGHVRDRPAVARPGAGGRELRRARPPLRRAGDPRPRPGPRAEVEFVGFRRADGRVAPAVHRVQRGDPRGARDRVHRVRRRALPAAPRRDPAATRSPASRAGRSRRPCRRESMEIMARMGVGPHGHRPEAVGDHRGRARGIPPALPRAQRRRGAQADPGRRGRREQGPRRRSSGCARSTCSAGPARRSSTTSSTTSGFAEIEGYEYYAALANNIAKHGIEQLQRLPRRPAGVGHARAGDREAARLRRAHRRRRPRGAAVASAACPPTRRTPASTCSPARCCPSSQRHDVGGDLGVTYGATAPGALTGA